MKTVIRFSSVLPISGLVLSGSLLVTCQASESTFGREDSEGTGEILQSTGETSEQYGGTDGDFENNSC